MRRGGSAKFADSVIARTVILRKQFQETCFVKFNRPAPNGFNPKELGIDWMGPKPTTWEFGQARVTLQRHRGEPLGGLGHEELLHVAKAFRVILGWFTIPEVDDEVLVAFRSAPRRQAKWELSEFDAVRVSRALPTLRRHGRQPLESLSHQDLLEVAQATRAIMQDYYAHSNIIESLDFPK